MKRKENGEREEEDEKKEFKGRIYTERENKHNNMRI